MTYFDLGRTDDANSLLDELIATAPDWYLEIAEVAAWLNKNDLAFKFLHKARDTSLEKEAASIPGGRSTVFMPSYAKLYDDPRWTEWRESIGMSEERLAAIDFNPELPE